MRTLGLIAASALVLPGFASALAQRSDDTAASAMTQAQVMVDFSQSRGERLHTERFNTWDNGDPEPERRPADVAFLNDKGLHADIIRIGIEIDGETCDLAAQTCDFSEVSWIHDVSDLTDSLVVHLTPGGLFEPGRKPEDLVPLLTLAIRELKDQVPKVDYIEAFNEPDWVNHVQQVRAGKEPEVRPEQLYDWYVPFYQAVNTVNQDLSPNERLRVGGPTLMSFDHKGWIAAFLDGYAADTNPDKRLDFVSWHGYGYFDEATGYRSYVFFKDDPSMVADQRARLDTMLRKRGITTYLPALVTETGVYPGPAFDDPDPSRNDWVRQGPGLASIHYWYAEQPGIYPFHWTVRHDKEGRKDQLVTLRSEGESSPGETFTPYGNMLLMQSVLGDERVVAQSNALEAGKGVYAIATKGENGAQVMVWNYQGTDATAYRVTLDMRSLPEALRGRSVTRRQYRIDTDTSNYWTDADNANLQQVEQTTVVMGDTHALSLDLRPNSMYLVTLDAPGAQIEPIGRPQ